MTDKITQLERRIEKLTDRVNELEDMITEDKKEIKSIWKKHIGTHIELEDKLNKKIEKVVNMIKRGVYSK